MSAYRFTEDVRMSWPSITSSSISFSLDHLAMRVGAMDVARTSTRPARHFDVISTFGSHCFSRARPHADVAGSDEAVLVVGRETRIFCPARHRLSTMLPSIVDELASRPCFHNATRDGRRNFLTVERAAHHRGTSEYHVYFRCWRDRDALRLHIESAHLRDARSGRKRVSFAVIAAKVMAGESFRVPP